MILILNPESTANEIAAVNVYLDRQELKHHTVSGARSAVIEVHGALRGIDRGKPRSVDLGLTEVIVLDSGLDLLVGQVELDEQELADAAVDHVPASDVDGQRTPVDRTSLDTVSVSSVLSECADAN